MKRKLIKQGGGGGITIYLPKKWIDTNSLKGGDEVNVEEEENKIVIEAGAKESVSRQEVAIEDHSDEFVLRVITNAYKKGIDELRLVFKKDVPLKAIKYTLSRLTIGYEVTDLGKDYCVIRSFSSDDINNIDVSIKKCFFLIRDVQETILKDIKGRKFPNEEQISSANENIKKLSNYAIRTSIKKIKAVYKNENNLVIFTNLYLYTNKLVYIYQHLNTNNKINKKISKDTVSAIQTLFGMFNDFYDAYYNSDLKKINRIS